MSKVDNSTILIVNDAPELLELMSLQLRESGHETLTATDGREGIEIARRHRPDMLISDVVMPEVNGIELCRMIRAEAELRTIPVLLVSGIHKEDAKVVEGLKSGADDYLEIPYNHARLIAKVARLLERKHAEGLLKFQAQLLDSVEQAVIATDLEGKISYWNRFAEKLYGWSAAEAIGDNIVDLMSTPTTLEQATEIMSHLREGRSWSGEFLVKRKDGTTFPAIVTDSPLYDEKEALVGIVGITFDLSERKRAEEALQTAHDELEKRVEARTVELLNANIRLRQEVAEHQRTEQILRTQYNLLKAVIEGTTDYIFVKGLSGRYLMVNSAAANFIGMPPEEIIGKGDLELFPPEFAQQRIHSDREVIATGEIRTLEEVLLNNSRPQTSLVIKNVYRNDEGKVIGLIGIARDITERKQMEKSLRESEERFRLLIEGIKDYAIFMLDTRGVITTWNEGAARLKGYQADEIIGQHFSICCTPEDRARGNPEQALKIAATADHYEDERWVVRKDGSRFWANIIINALRDEEGILLGFAEITRDITERMRAKESRLQLQRRLAESEEEERRRISRELHDQMGQYLPALMVGLKALENSSETQKPRSDLLVRLQEITARMAREVHDLSRDLRPVALDDFGLQVALANYVEEWSERHEIAADFYGGSLGDKRFAPHLEITLYRVAQEALTNVFKHARARKVSIILEYKSDEIRLIIEDDGQGFDTAAVSRMPSAQHRLGLLGMRERVTLAGGTLEIESALNIGTTVIARIPLSSSEGVTDHG